MNDEELNLRYADALQLLQQLIAIPSVSRNEDEAAAFLASYFEGKNIRPHRVLNNVWVTNQHFDRSRPTIMLNSHIDTVRPNEHYGTDPYLPRIESGKLFGLGSNDAGGSLVALIAVFLHFYPAKDLRYNLLLAATAEEEVSGIDGLTAVLSKTGPIACGIVGEPTLMQMAVAEKGLLVLDCIAHGKPGHAARDEGINAIYMAMKDIHWFQNHHFPKVSPLLGPVKMTTTMIQAGTQHNVVPGTCAFTVDCRINECYSHEEVLSIIDAHTESEITPRSMRLRSSSIAVDHPLVIAGLKLNRGYYGSPTLSDKALMPFPALKMGPGDSARSHIANEFIYTEEIREGIRMYIHLLNELL